MNRKWLLITILVLTVIAIGIILVLGFGTRFNKLVVDKTIWDEIKRNKTISTSISLDNIKFNDYNLLIDEKNSNVYYSMLDLSSKFNPLVDYKGKYHIAINSEITEEKLEKNNEIEIMIYDENNYRIYHLIVTKLPILNITYSEENSKGKRIMAELTLFDNYVNSNMRVMKSKGDFTIVSKDEYRFSLIKESLGHNKRENNISIFGMDKHDEYILRRSSIIGERHYVQFFINNEYKGVFELGVRDERSMRNERGK